MKVSNFQIANFPLGVRLTQLYKHILYSITAILLPIAMHMADMTFHNGALPKHVAVI